MNELLDFIGALLFVVVMVVISPLLLLVYTFIALLITLKYFVRSVTATFVILIRFKNALLHLDLKKYIFFYKSQAYK